MTTDPRLPDPPRLIEVPRTGSFMARAMAGEIAEKDLPASYWQAVLDWEREPGDEMSRFDYLGMSPEENRDFRHDKASLADILAARRASLSPPPRPSRDAFDGWRHSTRPVLSRSGDVPLGPLLPEHVGSFPPMAEPLPRPGSFMARCLAGEIALADMDDAANDAISDLPMGSPLSHEWLGLTEHEYALWVEERADMADLVAERRAALPVEPEAAEIPAPPPPAGPRFVVLSRYEGNPQLIDTLTGETLYPTHYGPDDLAGIRKVAALLNNAYPMPREKPHDAPCGTCGRNRIDHTSDCPRHAWVAKGGPR